MGGTDALATAALGSPMLASVGRQFDCPPQAGAAGRPSPAVRQAGAVHARPTIPFAGGFHDSSASNAGRAGFPLARGPARFLFCKGTKCTG